MLAGSHRLHTARETNAERFAKVGTYELYRVACNLVNGLPPRYLDHLRR